MKDQKKKKSKNKSARDNDHKILMNYLNDPFVKKKADEAQKSVEKYGFPEWPK